MLSRWIGLPLCLALFSCENKPGHSHGKDEHGGHREEVTKVAKDSVRTEIDPAGKSIVVAGTKPEGAVETTLAELLKDVEKFKGKTVEIKGNVSAMCTHRRAWFALVPDDRSGGFVRILAAPAFLVPEDAIGKLAHTAGQVEIVEIAPDKARYFAEKHKLGDPSKIDGPQKQVVLRASWAKFL